MLRVCLSLCVWGCQFAGLAGLPFAAGANPVSKLQAFPERVGLTTARDRQGLVVLAKFADGSTRDVSSECKMEVAASSVARLDGGLLLPVADGKTELLVEFDGNKCVVPIEVKRFTEAPELRFRNDVLPILTRAGCNTGKCHGSASGKDGFRLSLFGYDPAGDHYRLTRELPGRRINLSSPEDCLLVSKSTGSVPHSGGKRLEPESTHYHTLLSWLLAGAQADPPETRQPIRLDVFPRQAVFADKEKTQKMVVVAQYNDGSTRDVTDLAVFLSNNESVATVTEHGLATGTGPGSAFILARFDQFTQGMSIIVRPGTSYEFPEIPANNYIDQLAYERWQDLHLLPSDVCSDEVFLRRVSIDLIGLLPTTEQRREFLEDRDPERREKVVDKLLKRDEFRDLWGMKFAEMLQIRTNNGLTPKGLALYDRWLRDRVRADVTIDKIVRELIPANGGTFENPATSYYQTETTPQLLAESVAQSFLGTRIQCAQCHNHPFDRWTMDDYYGFASFFSQVSYKQAADPREITVFNAGTGEMKHPLGDRQVAPKYLGGELPAMAPGADRRELLANWLASRDNSDLARNLANVVWAHFNGVGIVEPVDDMRVSNPPSNPALLDALGRHLAEYGFDIKRLARDICTSRTYQLTTRRNASNALDERNFSHAGIRRLRAEVLLDCLNLVTGTQDSFPGLRPGARAVQLADGRTNNYFLTTFGRSTRQSPCTCEVKTSPTLSQALHLINGETTSGKIEEGGVVERLLAERQDPMAVVDGLYERCLTRRPTEQEAAVIKAKLANSTDVRAALVDLFWALLNSNEFIFNH